MWGRGEPRVSGEAANLENRVLQDYGAFARGLEAAGLDLARRALRLPVADFSWQADAAPTLVLEFFLPAGAYATAVLREVIATDNPEPGDNDAHEN